MNLSVDCCSAIQQLKQHSAPRGWLHALGDGDGVQAADSGAASNRAASGNKCARCDCLGIAAACGQSDGRWYAPREGQGDVISHAAAPAHPRVICTDRLDLSVQADHYWCCVAAVGDY
eukprot:scaffold141667_cov16-Tisochrysis_lutea.AAC.1